MAEPLRRNPRSDDYDPETNVERKRPRIREVMQPPAPPTQRLTMCGCTATAPSAQTSQVP